MSIASLKYCKCDGCGDPGPAVTGTAVEARAAAGFVRKRGLDLCPRCVKKYA